MSTDSVASQRAIKNGAQVRPTLGRFVILEGADGTGKTTLLREIRRAATAAEREVVVPSRSRPAVDDVYAGLVKEIARFYADGDEQRLPNRLLLTAAATQYQAMYHGQVLPALDRGALVLTDGWWNKTWSRLVVEQAAECRGRGTTLDPGYHTWASGLFANEYLADDRIRTFLVDTPRELRRQWYSAKPDRECVFDRFGRDSSDPEAFAWFTEEIQDLLRGMAAEHRWPVLVNDGSRPAAELAVQVLDTTKDSAA